jgi:outer membrane receptor protein involved in Fe transport
MFKKLLSGLCLMLLITASILAQSGTLMGKLKDKDTGEPIPFANIVAETAGRQMGGTTTNFDGEYTIRPINPGRYDVKATYVGYKPIMIQNVIISPDRITFLDIEMESTAVTLTTFEVIDYRVPLIEKDGGASGGTLTKEEIEKMPGRSATSVAVTVGGVFSQDGEVGSIRGQRSEGTVMYIDGVRVRGSSALPKSALDQVQVITGGLPAQYGDATGGIIQITTRGASREFGGGVELLTSQFLDPYGYNLLGFSVQGPLIKGAEANQTSLLGFFLSGELSSSKDGRPFATPIGVYKAKDDVLEYLENNPLRPSGLGFGSFQNGSYIRMSDLEKMNSKMNNNSYGVNLAGRLDVRTNPNSNLAFGGSLNYNTGIAYIHDYSLFNYKNFPLSTNNTWRVYGRYMQRFPTDTASNSPIKNVNYTIQADYSKYTSIVQDANHKDNLFDYGYIGKFTTHKIKSYELGDLPGRGLYDVYIHNGFRDTLYNFEPMDVNPILATYTGRYYGIYPLNSGMYSNSVLVQNGGGLLNGQMPPSIYGLWTSPGTVYNSYAYSDASSVGINAQASADIGRHSIQFGFQYEQRVDRYYGAAPSGLWFRMRQLANKHIEQIDTVNPILVFDEWGIFQDTVWYNRLYDAASQSFFDYNLRQHLKLPVNGLDWLDIDSYDPSTFDISWFSADELLNEGTNPYVAYYGYDHTGKKLSTKPSFDDFFTKQDQYGNYTREIPAFEPIYMAGYIQDKFAFRDLIFNIGVRVDRFDANQKVLKDPFLLYEAKTVGDVGNEFGEIPSNMGKNYVIYMNDTRFPTAILGYRDGDVWYNSQGLEITDPALISSPGGIAPYLINPELTKPTSDSFKDYEPQISVMPRLSFSFPISDEALFFAHYDVVTQRPTTGLRLDPTDYYFIQAKGQSVLSNPNLKPQMTVDYELGFQQMLNIRSAIKFSAYYKEMRNLIQVYRFTGAHPMSYISFNNIDFGTVKGMTISYDLRRSANIWIKAHYTLQFADGTGSSATSGINLVRTGQPNLRIINPLDYDRRHNFSMVLDYRYGKGKNYNGPVITRKVAGSDKLKTYPILQNTGINFTFVGGSGVPYSRSSTVVPTQIGGGTYVLQGSMNGSRLPWQFTINARLDRDISIAHGADKKKSTDFSVYLEVMNVLNAQNILGVYRATGNPDDDGYLAAAEYQAGIQAQLDPESFRQQYALAVNSPYNYSLPRRIRLGIIYNF